VLIERLIARIEPRELIGELGETGILRRRLRPAQKQHDNNNQCHDLEDQQDV
jgi:hypothetical protein